jgi:hypothetical protein
MYGRTTVRPIGRMGRRRPRNDYECERRAVVAADDYVRLRSLRFAPTHIHRPYSRRYRVGCKIVDSKYQQHCIVDNGIVDSEFHLPKLESYIIKNPEAEKFAPGFQKNHFSAVTHPPWPCSPR